MMEAKSLNWSDELLRATSDEIEDDGQMKNVIQFRSARDNGREGQSACA